MPTANDFNEFIRQNGAFGVLILLIIAFCYWVIPYVAKRYEKLQEEADKRLDAVIAKFDARLESMADKFANGLKENTVALQGITKEIAHMNDRLTDLEEQVREGTRLHVSGD